jgi:hypothetical protein
METIRPALAEGAMVEMPEIIGTEDMVVMVAHMDELPSFFPPDAEGLFQVVETRGGHIVRIRDFTNKDEALAEAGLAS